MGLVNNLFMFLSFKDYHPSRVLTLVYQPFALVTMLILAYNESTVNTRKRNIFGYALFFASTFGLVIVSFKFSIFSFEAILR